MPTTRQWEIQNQCFERQNTVLSQTFYVLKTWFELLRVKLYGNSLKGNKNYFELVGGLSY